MAIQRVAILAILSTLLAGAAFEPLLAQDVEVPLPLLPEESEESPSDTPTVGVGRSLAWGPVLANIPIPANQWSIETLTALDGVLFVGGSFFSVANNTVPAEFIACRAGSTWLPVAADLLVWTNPPPPASPVLISVGNRAVAPVTAITVHAGQIHASGVFRFYQGLSPNGTAPVYRYSRVARWDGATWLPVGLTYASQAALPSIPGTATQLLSMNGKLYSGAESFWNGSTWTEIPSTILGGAIGGGSNLTGFSRVVEFEVGGGAGPTLYAIATNAAYPQGVPGYRCVAKLIQDTLGWYVYELPVGFCYPVPCFPDPTYVDDLAVFDANNGLGPQLYVGGGFTGVDGSWLHHIARWNGPLLPNWSEVGHGMDDRVLALAVMPDDGTGPALIAGGTFKTAGEFPANQLARWNGSAWSALGNNCILPGSTITRLKVVDVGTGPELYAEGTLAGAPSGVLNKGLLALYPTLGHVVMGDPAKGTIPLRSMAVELRKSAFLAYQTFSNTDGGFAHGSLPDNDYSVTASTLTYQEPLAGNVTVTNYCCGWDTHATHWLSSDSPSDVMVVFPWPVMLQGGFQPLPTLGLGSSHAMDTWQTLFDYLGGSDVEEKVDNALPSFMCFVMPTSDDAGSVSGYDYTGSNVRDHEANGKRLYVWLDGHVRPVLKRWVSPADMPALRIDVIAHSMGAVIARVYRTTEYPGDQLEVRRSISLDGVHGGTRFHKNSTWGANPQHFVVKHGANGLWAGSMSGVISPTYWGYSVFPWNTSYPELPADQRLNLSIVDDFVVTPDESGLGVGESLLQVSSIFGNDYSPTGTKTSYTVGHSAYVMGLPGLSSGTLWHVSINTHTAIHRVCADFLAKGIAPSALLNLEAHDSADHAALDAGDFGSSLSGQLTLPQAGVSSSDLWIDSTDSIDVVLDIQGDAIISVLQNGVALRKESLVDADLGAGHSIETFTLSAPAPGKLVLLGQAGLSGPATISYSLLFKNARQVSVLADAFQSGPGASLMLKVHAGIMNDTSAFIVPTGPSTVTGTIHLPNGDIVNLPMYDNGLASAGDSISNDGNFSLKLTASTPQKGRYAVDVHCQLALGSVIVDRTGSANFDVYPGGATFSGTPSENLVDEDSNGKADILQIGLAANLSGDGSYRFAAHLVDNLGQGVSVAYGQFDNTAGAATVPVDLKFRSEEIVNHGVAGPWRVTLIELYDQNADGLPVASAQDFWTSAWGLAAFDALSAPVLLSVSPNSGPVSGYDQVVVLGSGLGSVTSVKVGSLNAAFVVNSDAALFVTIPPLSPLQLGLPGAGSPTGQSHSAASSQASGVPPGPPQHGEPQQPKLIPADVTVTTPWGQAVLVGGYTYIQP